MSQRIRRIFVIGANAIFGVVSLAIAIRTTSVADRRIGFACAVLFGGLAALITTMALLDRGPCSAPTAPLRIDADGIKRLDRLDLFVSPGRVAVVAGVSLLFFVASYVVPMLDPSIAGSIIGVLGVAIGALAAAGATVQGLSRAPSISFELDSVTFRSPRRPLTRIYYSDIGSFFVTSVSSQRIVCIEALDPNALNAAITDPIERKRLARSLAWTGAQWTLPTTTTVTADDLAALLLHYVSASRAGASSSNVKRVDSALGGTHDTD